MKRVTLTLALDTVELVDSLAQTLSISRSALVNQLLADSLPSLVELYSVLPELSASTFDGDVAPDAVRRVRGRSAAVVEDAVRHALQALSDLDAKAEVTKDAG